MAALICPRGWGKWQWVGGGHGTEWAHLPPSCLQQIHTRPQQLKLAFSPFFAVPFLSVLIAPNQFLRQCMMLQCATGMPMGTDLYNIFTDHFVSYESEILSGSFISWSPRWIVWEFRVLHLLFKNPLVYYTCPPEFSTQNQLEDRESRTWVHRLNQMWIWWSHYFLPMSFLKWGS